MPAAWQRSTAIAGASPVSARRSASPLFLLFLLGFPSASAFLLMIENEGKTNDDTPSPEIKKDGSNGDGTERLGLIIDVVLPKKEPDDKPDLGNKH